jgi:hypothetical protein
MYVGTGGRLQRAAPVFAQGFMQGLGSRACTASATQDCANKFAVAQHMYGFCVHAAVPGSRSHAVPDRRRRQPGGQQVELPAGAEPGRSG